MKITGPDKSGKVEGSKKASKSSSSSGVSFGSLLGADEAADAAPASSAGAITKLDVLLAAQSAEDPAERAARNRMRKRADNILRELDKLRLGMLTGTLTVGQMVDVADVVSAHRERIQDPELTAILDEIDLRAQIEIAKMRYALDQFA